MSKKLCLATIRAEYNNFTKTERRVADYILKNYENASEMTITALAENAGVVKSAIIRFCQTMGFKGYAEFRSALSKETVRNKELKFTPYIDRNDDSGRIFDKIFAANIKTLHDTADGIDKKMLDGAVSALNAANNIYIYGIGTSAGIVSDFQYRLMQLGFNAFCFTDITYMKVSTMYIKKGDVAVGISNSGRTIATVDSLRLAKESGAKTICITSYPKCEIVKTSDYPLVIKTDEIQYPIEVISSRIAHISVLDSIAIALSARRFDDVQERSAIIHDLIDTVRY